MFAKDQQRTLLTVMVLILGTLLLYWPVHTFDFINWDDGLYVLNNEHINHGFSWLGCGGVFKSATLTTGTRLLGSRTWLTVNSSAFVPDHLTLKTSCCTPRIQRFSFSFLNG